MDVKLHECKSCRKRKEIVISTRGLQYCEDCKHKAPTPTQYKNWKFEKSKEGALDNEERFVKKKKSGMWGGH